MVDIAYTDERVSSEDWPERKKSIPGGKLPVLMVDDKVLRQSMAIARYVAREAGLVPQDNLEAAFCDSLVETVSEILLHLHKIMRTTEDQQERNTKIEQELIPNYVEPFFTSLDSQIQDHEWYFGDQVTWADLMIGRAFCTMVLTNEDLFNKFPAVRSYVEKVCALPGIQDWIQNRPQTTF